MSIVFFGALLAPWMICLFFYIDQKLFKGFLALSLYYKIFGGEGNDTKNTKG